jgi:kumamolisin
MSRKTLFSVLFAGLLTVAFLCAVVAPSAVAQTALPYPTAATPAATDLGPLEAQPNAAPISVTVALGLSNPSGAEALLKSINTPGDPQYQQFLTPAQFLAQFGPTSADVTKVVAALSSYGLTVQRATSTTLKVTGEPAAIERAFSVSLHAYEVPAHGTTPGYKYHAPLSIPVAPSEISASVAGVAGLDSRPSFHPHLMSVLEKAPIAKVSTPSAGSTLNFGSLTVLDFAKYYDVDPLYEKGVTGSGRTLGIMTLAAFTPSDAYAYWKALGLRVSSKRITVVNIDGGPGAPSDASGSLETTIDVEQSGGIAPGANIVVYQAPNTDQGFVDLFATAIDANLAETLSISWGSWEGFNTLQNSPVTDPITGQTTSALTAVHQLLVRAGIQGETTFAASGDGGAYEANNDLDCFGPYSPSNPTSCSQPLTVGYPASDTAMTAAGGTTLANKQELCLNAACTPPYFTINIPHERVWGWDYLEGLCVDLGVPNPVQCGIFPAGSDGGVSVFFLEPYYQFGVQGVQLSQPGQVWRLNTTLAQDYGIGTFFALPPFYPGRNTPDVSFNADPYTGYEVYYTSDVTGFSIQTGWGGTSFVGPQLNGCSALFGQYLDRRLGLLNYALYDQVTRGQAYGYPDAPFNIIAYGDNWFYQGRNGYSPAVGVGTMNVANFANTLRYPF